MNSLLGIYRQAVLASDGQDGSPPAIDAEDSLQIVEGLAQAVAAMKEVTPEMAELATGAEAGSTIAGWDATAAMFTSTTYKMLVAFRGAAAARVLARNRVRAMMLRQAERLHEQDWGTTTGRQAELNRGHETW